MQGVLSGIFSLLSANAEFPLSQVSSGAVTRYPAPATYRLTDVQERAGKGMLVFLAPVLSNRIYLTKQRTQSRSLLVSIYTCSPGHQEESLLFLRPGRCGLVLWRTPPQPVMPQTKWRRVRPTLTRRNVTWNAFGRGEKVNQPNVI